MQGAMEAEQRRIRTVHSLGLLDTAPEDEFDELVRLAATVCETPMSAVSLIDSDRQFLKASFGPLARETRRDISFCTHALENDRLMVVPDAANDPKFRDNPLVTSAPGIRFYAGMPLQMPDGNVVGTLCVIDKVPRTLTQQQEEALMTISRQTVERMELRQQKLALEKALAELGRSQQRLEETNRRLADMSLTDALTGLANRRAFDEALRREIARSQRRGSTLSLVMMDIDNFKRRNDTYGHLNGDAVLRKVGEILRNSVRTGDLAARYGGEEFVLLLAETGRAGAAQTAERVRSAMHAASWDMEPVTMSLGVATLGRESADKSMLVELADEALYKAKRAGKNCVIAAPPPPITIT